MPLTKQQKNEILDELKQKFKDAKSVIFTEYRGLDVKSISELRNQMRESKVEYKIAKKTLIRLAAKEIGIDEIPDETMNGPVAVAFSYEDQVVVASLLAKFAKEHKEQVKLIGGILDGKVIDASVVNELASIPSKEELYAKLLGSMNSPISGFVGVSSGVVSGFVRALNAVREKKEAEEEG